MQTKLRQGLVLLAIVPVLLLPLLVSTCSGGGKTAAPSVKEPVSDVLTAGY